MIVGMDELTELREREIKAWLLELEHASKRSDFPAAGRRIRGNLRRLGYYISERGKPPRTRAKARPQ